LAPDQTCGGNRAPGGTIGVCHTFTYGTSQDSGLLGYGQVTWQYPADNWGANPGYRIPDGATKVSFYARGATGHEVVAFGIGSPYNGPVAGIPCYDTALAAIAKTTLSTTWTHLVIPLNGQTYSHGVLNAFTWAAIASDQPTTVTSVTFYIDAIEWQ
jgi:hypothetical protein